MGIIVASRDGRRFEFGCHPSQIVAPGVSVQSDTCRTLLRSGCMKNQINSISALCGNTL